MNIPQSNRIPDHETLARFARDDPAAYEAWRERMIDALIESAPARLKARLRGLQWRVDWIRKRSGSALGSTLRINELMWDSFHTLNDCWQDLASLTSGKGGRDPSNCPEQPEAQKSARIIELQQHRKPAPSPTKSADEVAGRH